MPLQATQHRRWEKIARDRRRPTTGKIVPWPQASKDAIADAAKTDGQRARDAMTDTDAIGHQARNQS